MSAKRILVNLGIVLVLAAVAVYCYNAGKAYKILLENLPYTENGVEQPGIEALNATIDDQPKPIFMLEGDRTMITAVGREHRLKIDILDMEDNVVESKAIEFSISDLGESMSLNVVRAFREGKP